MCKWVKVSERDMRDTEMREREKEISEIECVCVCVCVLCMHKCVHFFKVNAVQIQKYTYDESSGNKCVRMMSYIP